VLGADGHEVLYRVGDVTSPMYPRSSNKPMQAATMRRLGLDLEGELLALASASHSGEDFHVTGVRKILASAGLTEDALQCPPALPMDEDAQWRFIAEGGRPDRVHMNCSGKHAAMLATCVAAGWPTGTYTDPGHPLQLVIKAALGRLAGEQVAATGVDGCGAPLFAVSLTGLARAFGSLVLAQEDSAERLVADAVRANPHWTSGTRRAERALMQAVPGLLIKSGAEGVQAFALADGRAVAVKMEDGGARAIPAVTVALLRMLGVDEVDRDGRPFGVGTGADPAALDRVADLPVYGGGQVVGQILATLPGLPPRHVAGLEPREPRRRPAGNPGAARMTWAGGAVM
jgi:L-asparaginase II